MTTPTFNRGLSERFVQLLNAEYGRGGWWRNLVDDPELFVAIREEYINVYYKGCSLLRLSHRGDQLIGEVHYKYLIPSSRRPEHIAVVDGVPEVKTLDLVESLSGTQDAVKNLKSAAEPYAGEEKKGVYEIVRANPNVIDVEIALDGNENQPDLAALHEHDGQIHMVFYEAKAFSNPDLRSSRDATPRVLRQISRYAESLRNNHDALAKGYRRVCHNLYTMNGLEKRHPERHKMLSMTDLRINTDPSLLVYYFDADQRDGRVWGPHHQKLYRSLGERLKAVGDPSNIKL